MMDEQLNIGGHDIAVPGCCLIVDLAPLLSWSEVRGGSRVVPRSPGASALPKREDLTVVNLELVLLGDVAFDGVTAHPDPRTGLYRNVAWLQANIVQPVAVAPFTRTATLSWHAETPVAKPVQVIPPLGLATDKWHKMRAVLRLEFPEGLFELV